LFIIIIILYYDQQMHNYLTNYHTPGLGMYREWKKIEFPEEYFIRIWEQQDWGVDQEIEDVRIVFVEGWQEKVHNREEWKTLMRTPRNRGILDMPVEWNEWNYRTPTCYNTVVPSSGSL